MTPIWNQFPHQLFVHKLGGHSPESLTNFRYLAEMDEPVKCEKTLRTEIHNTPFSEKILEFLKKRNPACIGNSVNKRGEADDTIIYISLRYVAF